MQSADFDETVQVHCFFYYALSVKFSSRVLVFLCFITEATVCENYAHLRKIMANSFYNYVGSSIEYISAGFK